MLKILYDKYLDLLGKFLDYVYLVMLFFYECEKYFREIEWMEEVFVDCINGIFLQFVFCLQCCKCLYFFFKSVDLFSCKFKQVLDSVVKQVWSIVCDIVINFVSFDIF